METYVEMYVEAGRVTVDAGLVVTTVDAGAVVTTVDAGAVVITVDAGWIDKLVLTTVVVCSSISES